MLYYNFIIMFIFMFSHYVNLSIADRCKGSCAMLFFVVVSTGESYCLVLIFISIFWFFRILPYLLNPDSRLLFLVGLVLYAIINTCLVLIWSVKLLTCLSTHTLLLLTGLGLFPIFSKWFHITITYFLNLECYHLLIDGLIFHTSISTHAPFIWLNAFLIPILNYIIPFTLEVRCLLMYYPHSCTYNG